jgi:xanthine dehydrogenase YagR molybdenum-binding subunit
MNTAFSIVPRPMTMRNALNALGARGVGEIGLAGTAAAITAAVYHATGVRVRELPVRIEDLLRA